MKKLFILLAVVFATAIFSNLSAQEVAPPGAGDKDLSDKNIKMRSVELERIDREARKNGAAGNEAERRAIKYPEIKKDYELIQTSQDAVIKAYQSGSKIDYAQISKSASEINGGAVRLKENLFPSSPPENADVKKETRKDEKTEKEIKPAKSVRDLIVELDNAVGGFATSPMFQNLRVIDAAVSEKAKLDLEKIIEFSALLDAAAKKMTADGK